MKSLMILILSLLSLKALAQTQQTPQSPVETLVVSDIDDTIKLADVPSLVYSAEYVFDEHSHFMGMNHLYHLLLLDQPNARMIYLSKAPEWLMKGHHQRFLKNAGFPAGVYIGRTKYAADEHKLKSLRELIAKYRPLHLILIGDNGEQDAQVYSQTALENPTLDVHQYIHIVYHGLSSILPGQTGFVTSMELAQKWSTENLLSLPHLDWMLQFELPLILSEKPNRGTGSVAFPYFMNCEDIEWQWNISGLNEKIQTTCVKKNEAQASAPPIL